MALRSPNIAEWSMAEFETGLDNEPQPSGSYLLRETSFRQRYLEETRGRPKVDSAAEQLRGRSVGDRHRLFHRACLTHLAVALWPSDLYLSARLGRDITSDWTPYPTFGRYSVFFPDFYMNDVSLWEAGEGGHRTAGGAVLTWLNRYSTRLNRLELDTRIAEASPASRLGRWLGV